MTLEIIGVLEWVLLAVSYSFLAYLLLLTILAAFARKRHEFASKVRRSFAVVIPAHDEEEGIEETVRSIGRLEYARDRLSIVVIADNCTDSTAERARALGAKVLERTDPGRRGKGFALRWGFGKLLDSGEVPDAFVVIDADSVPSKNFLEVMNWYLEQGSGVVQASDLVSPGAESWSAQMTSIGFLLYNYVRPLGRRALGGSAGLRGNGMCFRSSILRDHPWSAFSISEDLEYGLQLLLEGVSVAFAPEAVVHAVMPHESRNAESQRARWEGGRWGLIRTYAGPLLSKALRTRSLAYVDALFDLLMPALVNFIALLLVLGAASVCIGLAANNGGILRGILWFGGAALGCVHLIWGLRIAAAEPGLYRALIRLPVYIGWKLKVYIRMPVRWNKNVWARTRREHHSPMHDVTKG